jgi:hypothetical protein
MFTARSHSVWRTHAVAVVALVTRNANGTFNHVVRDEGVAGSNPATPTKSNQIFSYTQPSQNPSFATDIATETPRRFWRMRCSLVRGRLLTAPRSHHGDAPEQRL